MQTTATSETNLVIRGDQILRQDIFFTPVGDINEIIQNKLQEAKTEFLPLVFPPILSKWVSGHFFATTPNKNQLLCFSKINYVPLKGCKLVPVGCHLILSPSDCENHRNRTDFNEKLQIPEGMEAFVMIPWNIEQNASSEPYMFFLHGADKEPVCPKLPNYFDTGKICTGGSYQNRNDGDVTRTDRLPLHHIKYLLNSIHEAPTNSHLRNNDTEFARWNPETKEQIQVPWSSSHYYTVTHALVLEFQSWYFQHGINL